MFIAETEEVTSNIIKPTNHYKSMIMKYKQRKCKYNKLERDKKKKQIE